MVDDLQGIKESSKAKQRTIPPVWWAGCLVGSVIIHFILPIITVLSFPYNLFGILIIVIGTFLTIWGDKLFKKEATTIKTFDEPSKLVTSGPFSFSRNPIYLGMVIVLLGVSLILGSLSSLASPLFFLILSDRYFIPFEEEMMLSVFGGSYAKYVQKVRRWF